MPWGSPAFNVVDKEITEGFQGEGGRRAEYQVVQWSAFAQTFATAIASNTGPAVSSGSSTMAFQYAAQGKIAYADNLLKKWKENGLYDDFLPGLFDRLKIDEGYVAIPYTQDVRVLWQNRRLLEQAGVETPTDWQSYLDACEGLKKIGVYGFGTAGGAGSSLAAQTIQGLMINNGGGLFDEEQQPNCVTPENIEAVDFVLELVRKGYSDPASVSYTLENKVNSWAEGRFGMGWDVPTVGRLTNPNSPTAADIELNPPLTSPNGTKGALAFLSNIMMHTNTPSQEASEEFMTYYFQNMSRLWTENTGLGLPVLKSTTETPEFKADKVASRVLEEWLPIGKTYGAPGNQGIFENVIAVDGTQPPIDFAQAILQGNTDARTALTTLQKAIIDTLPNK
ncbi:extracellular solute-binding protein [Pseudarthrobacter sp. R1]|uniref:ABC transporter substrate-binding protein n=1 Tax=Pseudarthrobacter sp. R1 TaxID=2944934 RepID=UPI00210A04B0|nr:extracellular solute-binding protein [Pseudarthrobacter sp. R1]MCQ6272752.1 extracellular solute-binding protein [Pseudarthrobacter sp. R1]